MKILSAQWMPALAMRLCSLLFCCCCDHKRRIPGVKVFLKQSDIQWDAFSYAPCYYITSNPCLYAPVFSDHTYTMEFNPDIPTSIPVLIAAWCPDAILWRIRAIIILAFNRIFFWAWPHIEKEVAETYSFRYANNPPIADSYTTTTIILERFACFVKTALNHVTINRIQWVMPLRRI